MPTNAGGWEKSEMRAWLAGELYAELPRDLADVIVAVDKSSNNVGNTAEESAVTTTSDKLWLPAVTEVFPSTESPTFREGDQYQFFADVGADSQESNEAIEKEYDGEAKSWWTRSAERDGMDKFYEVHANGGLNRGYAYIPLGIAPCFCL